MVCTARRAPWRETDRPLASGSRGCSGHSGRGPAGVLSRLWFAGVLLTARVVGRARRPTLARGCSWLGGVVSREWTRATGWVRPDETGSPGRTLWPVPGSRESSGRGVCPDFPVRGLLPALRRPALPWRLSGQPGPLGSEVGRVRDRRGKARTSQLGGAGSRSHNPYRDMRWIPIWRPSRGHSTLSPADPLVTYLKTRPAHSA